MSFSVTFTAVLTMLLYAVPGYILRKTGAVGETALPAFSKLLLYVGSPCLAIDSFSKAEFSPELLRNMGIFFLFMLLFQGALLTVLCIVWRRFGWTVDNRVCAVAGCFGNCSFFGIPLLNALLPDYAAGPALSSVYFLSMSIIGWTAGCAVITGDRRHISVKKIFLNPAVLSLLVAVPMFIFRLRLPEALGNMVELLGKMTTPICMIVLGMRLAMTKWSSVFCRPKLYLTALFKLTAMPLAALGLSTLLGLSPEIRAVLFITCSCPTASVVLNFAEILGEGQETAAENVLLCTILSLLSIPVLMLLLQ
jgi:predicted permease